MCLAAANTGDDIRPATACPPRRRHAASGSSTETICEVHACQLYRECIYFIFFGQHIPPLHLLYTSSRMKYMLHSDSRGTWMYASLLRSCIDVFHFYYSAYTSYFWTAYTSLHLVYTSSRMKYMFHSDSRIHIFE
jgi:hypothetical protein